MSDINKFTSKEVLNKVLLDSSGNAVEAFSHTTQEALNAALDTTNNRLNVSLAGGTISGDVTISGDLTVNGSATNSYDEIVNGDLHVKSDSGNSTSAFLVEKNDGTDVFTVDTTNSKIIVGDISLSGSTISDSGALTISSGDDIVIDAESDVNIDANGGDIRFKDNGTNFVTFSSVGSTGTIFTNGSSSVSITPDGNNSVVKLDKSATNRGARFEYSTATSTKWYQGLADSDHFSSGGDEYFIAEDLSGEPDFIIEPGGNIGMGMLPNISSGASGTKVLTISATASAKNALIELKGTRTGDGDFSSYIRSFSNSGSTPITDIVSKRGASDTAGSLELYTSNAIALTIDSSQSVTISSSVNGNPVTSGTTQTNLALRVKGSATNVLDIGQQSASPYGVWMQVCDSTSLGTEYPLLLNPNGGNVGIGVSSLEAQNTQYTALQLGGNANIIAKTSDQASNPLNIMQNAYNGTDTNWKKIREDQSSRYSQLDGVHTFFTDSGTGSADSVITWTTNLVLDADSRISLSNNDSGTSNTIFGKNTAVNIDDGSNYNVFIGENVADATTVDASLNVGVGYQALSALTTGDSNVAVGYNSMVANTSGTANVAYGRGTLATNVDGLGNTAIGHQALETFEPSSADTGYNTAVGMNALQAQNTGINNTVIGALSGDAITTSSNNVAVGLDALGQTTTGGSNVAVGYQAMEGDVDGDGADNVAIGHRAMLANVSPSKNVAVGDSAMRAMNGTANGIANCVAIGANAFYGDATNTTTGTNGTVAVGKDSLKALTTGAGNTAVGYQSGTSITTGVSNTLLGYQAGDGMTAGEDNVAVGHSSLGGASTSSENKRNVAVGVGSMGGTNAGASENVAIGYAALDANLTADADGNVAIGYYAGSAITEGEGNTILGRNAADALTTGDKNIAIGRLALSATQVSSNNIAIGYAAMNNTNDATSDGTVAIGYAALNNVTTGAGNVGVGYEVLKQVTTGKHNTSVGYQSMYNAMNVGDSNTAMGYQSLYSLDPDTDDHGSNTAVGKQSGYDVSTGTGNVLVGANAGNSGSNDLTTGDNNTYIGNEAAGASASNSNSTVIGATAIGSGSNTVVLGNASVTDVYMAQDSGATVHCANIQFPSSQGGADSGANVLDDYEEGDWTPVITDGSNDATMNSTFNQGKYTKIGRLVTVSFNCLTSSLGSVSGSISIKGFPFTVGNNYGSGGAGASAGFGNGLAITAGTTVTVSMNLNAATANLQHFDVSTGISALQHSEWTDDGNLKMSLSYMT